VVTARAFGPAELGAGADRVGDAGDVAFTEDVELLQIEVVGESADLLIDLPEWELPVRAASIGSFAPSVASACALLFSAGADMPRDLLDRRST
jgi:hypothetical protein